MKFSAVFVKTGKWYSAFIPEIPGVNTQGRSLESAKKNLKSALEDYCEANRKIALKEVGRDRSVIRESFAIS